MDKPELETLMQSSTSPKKKPKRHPIHQNKNEEELDLTGDIVDEELTQVLDDIYAKAGESYSGRPVFDEIILPKRSKSDGGPNMKKRKNQYAPNVSMAPVQRMPWSTYDNTSKCCVSTARMGRPVSSENAKVTVRPESPVKVMSPTKTFSSPGVSIRTFESTKPINPGIKDLINRLTDRCKNTSVSIGRVNTPVRIRPPPLSPTKHKMRSPKPSTVVPISIKNPAKILSSNNEKLTLKPGSTYKLPSSSVVVEYKPPRSNPNKSFVPPPQLTLTSPSRTNLPVYFPPTQCHSLMRGRPKKIMKGDNTINVKGNCKKPSEDEDSTNSKSKTEIPPSPNVKEMLRQGKSNNGSHPSGPSGIVNPQSCSRNSPVVSSYSGTREALSGERSKSDTSERSSQFAAEHGISLSNITTTPQSNATSSDAAKTAIQEKTSFQASENQEKLTKDASPPPAEQSPAAITNRTSDEARTSAESWNSTSYDDDDDSDLDIIEVDPLEIDPKTSGISFKSVNTHSVPNSSNSYNTKPQSTDSANKVDLRSPESQSREESKIKTTLDGQCLNASESRIIPTTNTQVEIKATGDTAYNTMKSASSSSNTNITTYASLQFPNFSTPQVSFSHIKPFQTQENAQIPQESNVKPTSNVERPAFYPVASL